MRPISAPGYYYYILSVSSMGLLVAYHYSSASHLSDWYTVLRMRVVAKNNREHAPQTV